MVGLPSCCAHRLRLTNLRRALLLLSGFLLAVEVREILKYFSVYRRDRMQNRIGVVVALIADLICASLTLPLRSQLKLTASCLMQHQASSHS